MSRRKLTPEHRSTEWVAGEGLKIPVFDMSLTDGRAKGRYQAESEVLRNSLLELLFEPEELASLTIVKPDPNDSSFDPLKNIDFGDGIAVIRKMRYDITDWNGVKNIKPQNVMQSN